MPSNSRLLSLRPKLPRRLRSGLRYGLLGLLLCLSLQRGFQLVQAAQRPAEAVLVLGGSIKREIYAASLARRHPERPILISAGADDPCLWLIFEREAAPKERVWLEPCADSTLGNYRFSLPTLQRWQVRHVQLVTSGSHQRRALGLGRIILGSHGIWVSPAIAPESGRPGNRESWLKTLLDWLRGLAWALVSQVYSPRCDGLLPLAQVELNDWIGRDFSCEAQGQVEIPEALQPGN